MSDEFFVFNFRNTFCSKGEQNVARKEKQMERVVADESKTTTTTTKV